MVKNVLNEEEKGGELLEEFISRFKTRRLKYDDPIKKFEIPQGKKNFNNRKIIFWKHSLYI